MSAPGNLSRTREKHAWLHPAPLRAFTLIELLVVIAIKATAHGAKLKPELLDTSAAEKFARFVKTRSLIAVLHEQPEVAAEALALIKAEWDVKLPGL